MNTWRITHALRLHASKVYLRSAAILYHACSRLLVAATATIPGTSGHDIRTAEPCSIGIHKNKQ